MQIQRPFISFGRQFLMNKAASPLSHSNLNSDQLKVRLLKKPSAVSTRASACSNILPKERKTAAQLEKFKQVSTSQDFYNTISSEVMTRQQSAMPVSPKTKKISNSLANKFLKQQLLAQVQSVNAWTSSYPTSPKTLSQQAVNISGNQVTQP